MENTPPLAHGMYPVATDAFVAVVTFLEMLAPPTRQRRPQPEGVTLEPWLDATVESYRALFRQVGSEWLWFSRLRWADEKLEHRLAAPTTRLFRLFRGDRPIGLLELDDTDAHTVELAFFGLVPGEVGQGLGSYLMQEALRLAWSNPAVTRVFVHTCTADSPEALPFYQKHGFKAYGRAIEVAEDPRVLGYIEPHHGQNRLPLIK